MPASAVPASAVPAGTEAGVGRVGSMPAADPTLGGARSSEAADLALPRQPGPLRRFWRRHPRWVDALVAGLYLVVDTFGVFSVFLAAGTTRPPAVTVVLLAGVVAGTAALLVRRRRPWATFVVIAATTLVEGVLDGVVDPVGIGLALYALAVYRSTRSAWTGFAIAAVAASALAVVLSLTVDDGSAIVRPVPLLIILAATLLGVAAGDRRRYVAALVDRAAQLARERDQQARLASAAERARIARELHDVVAHSLSVMVSLTDGAAALAEKDPARSREAVRESSAVGRQSLAEMRRLLGVLGANDDATATDDVSGALGGAPLHPQPRISDLHGLLASVRTAGLPVTLESHGEPPAHDGVQTVVFRVVQEALTNALRYATGATAVLVRLEYAGGGAEITVTDDGRVDHDTAPSVGSGRGLVGMRERAALYGGTAEAGPSAGGGWRVHVRVPGTEDDG